jgi:hypothetical protein
MVPQDMTLRVIISVFVRDVELFILSVAPECVDCQLVGTFGGVEHFHHFVEAFLLLREVTGQVAADNSSRLCP